LPRDPKFFYRINKNSLNRREIRFIKYKFPHVFVFRQITVVLLATLMLTVFFSVQYSFAKKVDCVDDYKDMEWDPKNHDVNDASEKEFEELAYHGSLCELSKCIDHEECTNHDSVDWQKFKSSSAYEVATENQKGCLTEAHEDGNGQDGLVGYEILECGINEDY